MVSCVTSDLILGKWHPDSVDEAPIRVAHETSLAIFGDTLAQELAASSRRWTFRLLRPCLRLDGRGRNQLQSAFLGFVLGSAPFLWKQFDYKGVA
jgi:hypothetical protein